MRKRMLAVVAAASLVVSIVAPAAYGTPVPPHPPAPPPVVQGSHHPNWTNDGLKAGACVLGGVMLLGSPEKDRVGNELLWTCLLYTSPSPRDRQKSRMPSSA